MCYSVRIIIVTEGSHIYDIQLTENVQKVFTFWAVSGVGTLRLVILDYLFSTTTTSKIYLVTLCCVYLSKLNPNMLCFVQME